MASGYVPSNVCLQCSFCSVSCRCDGCKWNRIDYVTSPGYNPDTDRINGDISVQYEDLEGIEKSYCSDCLGDMMDGSPYLRSVIKMQALFRTNNSRRKAMSDA
jgi:hypothetical protein